MDAEKACFHLKNPLKLVKEIDEDCLLKKNNKHHSKQ